MDDIAKTISSLERQAKGEEKKDLKSIPTSDWKKFAPRKGKKGKRPHKSCPGPGKCTNTLCDHLYFQPGSKHPIDTEPALLLDEKTQRMVDLMMTKCKSDGYSVSARYAQLMLAKEGNKLVQAIEATKYDIDQREAAFRATGRVSYESYEVAMNGNCKLVERGLNTSQAIPPNRTRDEAIKYLEDDDTYIKEFMLKGKDSAYGKACLYQYRSAVERKRAWDLYELEGKMRDDREVFYKERKAEGVSGVPLEDVMKEYDVSVALACKEEIDLQLGATADDGGPGPSNSRNPFMESVAQEDEDEYDFEQKSSQEGNSSDDEEDDDGEEPEGWQLDDPKIMGDLAELARIATNRELTEARKMFPDGMASEQVKLFSNQDTVESIMQSKFKEHFGNIVPKNVFQLFFEELQGMSTGEKTMLGAFIAAHNSNNEHNPVPDSIVKRIMMSGREKAEESGKNKGKGKQRAVESKEEADIAPVDLERLRQLARIMITNPTGQTLLSPVIKTALREDARQYDLRQANMQLLQQARDGETMHMPNEQVRKIGKVNKVSDSLFRQMSRAKVELEFEREKIKIAEKAEMKEEEARRSRKDADAMVSKAIGIAVEYVTTTHQQRVNEAEEELRARISGTAPILHKESFHYAGRPTGDPSNLADRPSQTGSSHPPSKKPPSQVPGRDIRQRQVDWAPGGKYDHRIQNGESVKSVCDAARESYKFEPTGLDPAVPMDVFADLLGSVLPTNNVGSTSDDSAAVGASSAKYLPPESFELDEPTLTDYLPDDEGDEVRDIHEVLVHLHQELCDGDIDSKDPDKESIDHVVETLEQQVRVRRIYAQYVIQLCAGSACMAVTFLERANKEFAEYFKERGIQKPTYINYELQGMMFIDAFYRAHKAMDADTSAREAKENK